MPVDFDKCAANKNGRVRRITLKGGRYMNICYLNGKSFPGEVHESKSKK